MVNYTFTLVIGPILKTTLLLCCNEFKENYQKHIPSPTITTLKNCIYIFLKWTFSTCLGQVISLTKYMAKSKFVVLARSFLNEKFYWTSLYTYKTVWDSGLEYRCPWSQGTLARKSQRKFTTHTIKMNQWISCLWLCSNLFMYIHLP